MSAPVNKQITS